MCVCVIIGRSGRTSESTKKKDKREDREEIRKETDRCREELRRGGER